MSLRAFSERIAKLAIDIRNPAASAPLVREAGERIRSALKKRDWRSLAHGSAAPSPKRGRAQGLAQRDSAIQIYLPQTQGAAGHEVADHIVDVVQKRLSNLTQNKDFESAKDPVEALHDFRVASRRLRAFVDVFEPLLDPAIGRRAKKPLRRITKTVRAMRDWDVQLKLLHERAQRSATDIERITLEDLIATAASERKETASQVRKQLRKLDFDELTFAVCATLGMTVTRLPPPGLPTKKLLWELLEPAVSVDLSLGTLEDGLEHAQEMHALRIRLKKLRYALELLGPAFESSFENLYVPVERMQDLLGDYQDLVVLSEFLEKRRRTLKRQGRVTLADAVTDLAQQLATERQVLAAKCRTEAFDSYAWLRTLKHWLGVEQVQS
jgi:CHAD domain-containing protein